MPTTSSPVLVGRIEHNVSTHAGSSGRKRPRAEDGRAADDDDGGGADPRAPKFRAKLLSQWEEAHAGHCSMRSI